MEASQTDEQKAQAMGLGEPDKAPAPTKADLLREQAPVATDRAQTIVGDSGMYEQQPTPSVANPDSPLRTSAPPPGLQSGVPLAEDRAAGVAPVAVR